MATEIDFSDSQALKECLDYMLELTKKAGEIVREGFFDRQKAIETKTAFYDIVTVYDQRTEEFLINGILEKYPDHKFIAEESSSKTDEKNVLTDAPTWIIDPIDGTNNFVHGIPLVCISIALAYKKEIVLGIGYNPILSELYWATKNQGAFLNGNRISVSKIKSLKGAAICIEVSIAGVAHFTDHIMTLCREIVTKVASIRAFGSAALTLFYVASGIIDAYQIEFLKPWDVAAGAIIVKEAGGIFQDAKGGEFDVMNPNVVAVSTPELYEEYMKISKECRRL